METVFFFDQKKKKKPGISSMGLENLQDCNTLLLQNLRTKMHNVSLLK